MMPAKFPSPSFPKRDVVRGAATPAFGARGNPTSVTPSSSAAELDGCKPPSQAALSSAARDFGRTLN